MLISYLKDEFGRRRERNARYSMRAFAKSLGMDASTLVRLLSRKRKLSAVQAVKIVGALDIDLALKSTFLLATLEGKTSSIPKDEDFVEASLEAKGMEHWEFFAILSLLELKTTKHSVAWLAEKLDSTRERVSKCLEGLEGEQYVKRVGNRWEIQGVRLTTRRGAGKWVVTNAQSEYIKKADEALLAALGDSDFSGMTLSVDSAKIPEAIRRIKEFRRSLASFMTEEPNDRVYRMNTQLFPLDRPSPKTKNKPLRSP